MKANKGDLIKITKRVCYGSFKGLVEVEEGKLLEVSSRNSSDDGVTTTEGINVWDDLYVICDDEPEYVDDYVCDICEASVDKCECVNSLP